MKKICLTILLFTFVFSNSQAQTQKGTKLIGGTGYVEVDEVGFGFGVAPRFGFFLVENFAIGSNLSFHYGSNEFNKHTSFGFNPFARYYFGKEAKIRLFTEIHAGVGLHRSKTTIPDQPNSTNTINYNSFGGAFGAAYFLTPQIGLETMLNYNNQKFGSIQKRDGRVFLSFGFQIHLPGSNARVSPTE